MATIKTRPTFTERCEAECTANVVFLFQVPRWIYTGMPYTSDGSYNHDGDGVILGDVDERRLWTPREDAEYLTNEQLEDMTNIDDVPCAVKTWETKFVTLTREEGEEHGKQFDYRYREGWRVYGIPCTGRMVDLIKET